MATKYLIAGGNGNFSGDTNYSTSSGGTNDTTHPVDGDALICDANSGATTLTVDVSSAATSITFTGFTGTFTGAAALSLKGNLLAVSGMTYSYTGTLTFALTAGTATITSAGKTICGACTLNGAGGTLTFADAFVTTGTCTLTAGTWNDGSRNLTMAAWACTGATARTLVMGGYWTITGSGTCWNQTGSNLTRNPYTASTVDFSYSGASARTVVQTAVIAEEHKFNKLKVSAGTGTVLFSCGTSTQSLAVIGLCDFTGYSGACSANGTESNYGISLFGGVTFSASMTFSRTGGGGFTLGGPVTRNGVSISGNVDVSWTTMTPQDSFVIGGVLSVAGAPGATSGSINANNQDITCSTFSSSNSVTRTINMGSGTWTLTSTAATTVWNMATTTGLTLNPGTATIDLTGNTTNVRTITANSVLLPTIKISGGTGAGSVTLTNVNCAGLTFANTYACTGFANQTVTIRGPVTLSNHASFALTAGANAWTLASTSGSNAFTSQGKTCDFPITINAPAGTHQLADALTTSASRTITHTAGTLDLNGFTLTCGIFNTSGSTTRVLTFGAGTLICSSTGVVFTCATSTGLTINVNTGTIKLTDSSGTARSISANSIALPSIWVSAGTSTTTFTAVTSILDLNCTGMGAGTITAGAGALSIGGSITLVSAMTWSYTGALTLNATSTGKTITSATKVLTSSTVTFNGVGAEWTLTDAVITGTGAWTLTNGSLVTANFAVPAPSITINNTSGTFSLNSGTTTWACTFTHNGVGGTLLLTGALTISNSYTLTNGSLNTNGQTVSTTTFSSSNANTRSLTLGATIWTVTATGTAWDCSTGTNLTVTPGTSTIKLTNATSTFAGGGKTYNNLWFNNASGTFNVTGSNTFKDIRMAA